jgi:hypothetical protein
MSRKAVDEFFPKHFLNKHFQVGTAYTSAPNLVDFMDAAYYQESY